MILSPDTLEKITEAHTEMRGGESFTAAEKDSIPLNPLRKFYIETYGCAMNFGDTEIIASVLKKEGFFPVNDYLDADLILINTCSIRDNAEQKVRTRLKDFRKVKRSNPDALIGVLGCMAERLKMKFL